MSEEALSYAKEVLKTKKRPVRSRGISMFELKQLATVYRQKCGHRDFKVVPIEKGARAYIVDWKSKKVLSVK